MERYGDIVARNIQHIGEEAFPDDVVRWAANRIFASNDHVFAEVSPKPATVGYERFIFVIRFAEDMSYRMTHCYCEENGWSLLFYTPSEDKDWRPLLEKNGYGFAAEGGHPASGKGASKTLGTGNRKSGVPPEFQGVPTRAGRIILFVFGLPFMLGAAAMLSGSIYSDTSDKLPLILGGTVFFIVGLFLWTLAFPNVVNRLRRSRHPAAIWLSDHAARIGMILLVIIMFGTPMLMALGIIPTDETARHAPRWVGIVAGGIFLVAGIYVLFHQRIQRMKPVLSKPLLGLFPLLIVTGMAIIADWIAFGPGERVFSEGISSGRFSFESDGGEWSGRIVFGLVGIFLSVITLIGWFNYLCGKW